MVEATLDGATARGLDRRRHPRLPVTLSARVQHAGRRYRTTILDVSSGGLLLAPVAALSRAEAEAISVEALSIGTVQARIVGVSACGIHVRVEGAMEGYRGAIERLTGLTHVWTREPPRKP